METITKTITKINIHVIELIFQHRIFQSRIPNQELDFWGFEEQEIEACCWNDYSRYTSHKGALIDLDNNVFAPGETATFAAGLSGWVLWKVRIWRFLEEPGAYPAAKVGPTIFPHATILQHALHNSCIHAYTLTTV